MKLPRHFRNVDGTVVSRFEVCYCGSGTTPWVDRSGAKCMLKRGQYPMYRDGVGGGGAVWLANVLSSFARPLIAFPSFFADTWLSRERTSVPWTMTASWRWTLPSQTRWRICCMPCYERKVKYLIVFTKLLAIAIGDAACARLIRPLCPLRLHRVANIDHRWKTTRERPFIGNSARRTSALEGEGYYTFSIIISFVCRDLCAIKMPEVKRKKKQHARCYIRHAY